MKLGLISILGMFISLNLQGSDLNQAPKNFNKGGMKYVFIDFQKANYNITYDVSERKVTAISELFFVMPEDGAPLFDLVPKEVQAKLISGKKTIDVSVNEVSSAKGKRFSTKYRSLTKKISAGNYSLKIKSSIDRLLTWNSTGVKSAFWMSDLSDRAFLERYLPTNLDYDNYEMNFKVQVTGTDKKHLLMINCASKRKERSNSFIAKCPKTYNTSGLYFHLFPEGSHNLEKGEYQSINGNTVKVISYGSSAKRFLSKSMPILKELEGDYGAWPYPFLIVYGAGSGGMEYNGATRTSMSALGHELHHTYFARGIHPAGGNGGWIDEAMASWRDDGYPSRKNYTTRTKMAGHSMYRRDTDRNAYSLGADIIAYFDHKFKDKGGMKAFMKDWAEKKMFASMTTPIFQEDLEKYFNTNLEDFFNKYIYGKGFRGLNIKGFDLYKKKTLKKIHKYHKPMSEKELISIL